MKKNQKIYCTSCVKYPLTKDEIGASMKLLGIETEQFYCIDCLSAYLEVTPEEIKEKIKLFKEDGCTLFQ